MQDVIKLLPDSVANQIAAGEVIQQPSSVIKELVENSIDAGATKIEIFIRDAGRTLIQVIDNGCGMTATDARLAFERHSTSKIREAADLFALTTMGFRGEALASIAAISQLDVRTMPHDATVGTRLVINGSKVESQEPEVTSPGTNFMVKNIFFNVPARRKFLKKDTVEFANILHEFERLALVNPSVELSLYHNDQLVHSLSRSNLKTRIGELFGRTVEDTLVPIENKTSLVSISGYIGTPSSARKRGALQYLFVNGRNMKHPYFRKAVLNCYEDLIPSDSQPNFFINFTVDPENIDVNIHPTKNEIKFENEQAIWQLLTASVKEALGRFNLGPSLDFENIVELDIQPFDGKIKPGNIFGENASRTTYNPFKESVGSKDSLFGNERRKALNWEKLYETPVNNDIEKVEVETTAITNIMQLDGKFVLTPSPGGLYIINQREAHVRILFEKYREQLRDKTFSSQNLLFTTIIELEPSGVIVLESIMESLNDAGFVIEHRSGREWEIKGVPSILEGCDYRELILQVIDAVSNEMSDNEEALVNLQKTLALQMAESAAIKLGKALTVTEMEYLISSLFSTSSPVLGPTGKQIIAELPVTALEKLFDN